MEVLSVHSPQILKLLRQFIVTVGARTMSPNPHLNQVSRTPKLCPKHGTLYRIPQLLLNPKPYDLNPTHLDLDLTGRLR